MKWFKHMVDASVDLKIIKVEEEYGLAGYAAFFKIIEYCAKNWEAGTEPIFEITAKHLQKIIRMKSKQSENIMTLFSQLNLFQISKSENVFFIKCSKLLDIKDEASAKKCRKSGIETEKVVLELELELESELKLKKEIKEKESLAASQLILDFWNSKKIIIHSNEKSPKILEAIAKKLKKKDQTFDEIKQSIENYAAVVNSPDTFFKTKWPLATFFSRKNADAFWPENFVFENYLNRRPESFKDPGVPRVFVEMGPKVNKAHLENNEYTIVEYSGPAPVQPGNLAEKLYDKVMQIGRYGNLVEALTPWELSVVQELPGMRNAILNTNPGFQNQTYKLIREAIAKVNDHTNVYPIARVVRHSAD